MSDWPSLPNCRCVVVPTIRPGADGHDFDPFTSFCLRCGCRAMDHYERPHECPGGGNVIAISHRIAKRRFSRLLGGLLD